MKYIRTKDGIYDLSRFKFEKGDIDQSKWGSKQDCYWEQHDIEYCPHRCIWVKDIIKQADTIKELCDEFVVWGEEDCPTPISMPITESEKYQKMKNIILLGMIGGINCWFRLAIWTDKGLIYVAEMNKDGDLCLI